MYGTRPEDSLFLDAEETILTEVEITYYLKEAFNQVVGFYPSIDSLAILWAQVCLEIGHGEKCFNYNYGNEKKLLNIQYTSYHCTEYINGVLQHFEPYHPQTFFAAWENPMGGAVAYLRFLATRPRYQTAWQEILKGNPETYAQELKKAGYYTDTLEHYLSIVLNLTNNFKHRQEELLSWSGPKNIPIQLDIDLNI